MENRLASRRINQIRGAGGVVGGNSGGKGGGGSAAQSAEAEDTLYSASTARIVVALGEGPIEGPVSGTFAQDLILNNVPLMSPSGELNYQGFEIDWRSGTPDQTPIPGAVNVEQERVDPQKVFNGIPVVRNVLDSDVDAVRVRLRVPSLREIKEDTGSSVGATVIFRIEVASAGQPYVQKVRDQISGKTTSPYERAYQIALDGNSPWNVRVIRETPDSNNERLANDLVFQSITDVEYSNRRYPDVALISMAIDARQFNSIPRVFLNARGLKVLVPHNYNAFTAAYSGFFDGTLKESWTNNPVWVLLDLLTDKRYGAGISFSRLDISSFYSAAVHCDERISNGEGGTERRWVFNGSIESRGEAYKICESVAATFHGILYWSGSKVRLSVDRDKKPIHTYSSANVISERDDDGSLSEPAFQYSDISAASVHTVCNVSYREPQEGYQLKTVQYRDEDAIARFGYRPVDVTAFGCTSRTQAYRYGRWRILTEKTQRTTISFRIGREGLMTEIGDVVYVYDTSILGTVQSGRILAATPTLVAIDSPVAMDLSGGTQYELITVNGTGQGQHSFVNVANSSGDTPGQYTSIAPESPMEYAPAVGSTWGIVGGANVPQQFKIVNISESTSDGTYKVDAVQHEPGKFASIEDNIPLVFLDVVGAENPYARPKAVTNISTEEFLFSTTGSSGVRVRCEVSWSHVNSFNNRAERFRIESRSGDDPQWQVLGESIARSFSVVDIAPGQIEFRITPVSPNKIDGDPASATAQIYGLTAPPNPVTGFRHQYISGSLRLSWDKSPDLDVRIGGDVLVYHSPILNAPDIASAALIAILPGDHTQHFLAPITGTYFVKSRDSTGNESESTSRLNFDGATVLERNLLLEVQESPDFFGNKVNVTIDADIGAIKMANTQFGEGIYSFQNVVDLGGSVNVRLLSESIFSVINEGETIDSAPGLFDSRSGIFDSVSPDKATSRLEFSTSDDGQDYTSWATFADGDYKFRYCRLRVVLATQTPDYNSICSLLKVKFDVDDLIQEGTVVASADAAVTVAYDKPFFQAPLIITNIVGPSAGDYVLIQNVTKDTFEASAFNGANAQIAKNIVYIAKGY